MPRTRRQQQVKSKSSPAAKNEHDNESSDSSEDEMQQEVYEFEGKQFDTFQEMVDAKRKRNHDILVKSGLLGLTKKPEANKASQRGSASKRRKTAAKKELLPRRRKSSRLAGVEADNIYIENEAGGKFTISGGTSVSTIGAGDISASPTLPAEPEHFKNRIAAEGVPLSIKDAIELSDSKWIREDSAEKAVKFVSDDLTSFESPRKRAAAKSPTSVVPIDASLSKKIGKLSVDDDANVAKVTADRIYSVACHPSTDKLIVCAGDKKGYIGIWNVDDSSEGDGVHLFRVHGRPVSCLSWTPSGRSLLSASYDGSVRWLDVESQTFHEIFATYDDEAIYRNHLGKGLDQGYQYWTQYVCPDPRNASEQCFFMSTSFGTAMHVDLRVGKGKLTFHEDLSDKKINTLSLHPDGYTLASAGLDKEVRLWDIRNFRDDRKGKRNLQAPLTVQQAGKSVNSAFFSPSGSTLLSTTMADSLDITKDAHLCNKKILKATKRVRHNNRTGRWLTTFMAQWHPSADIFVVGSMKQPRCIELFDCDGNLLRAVDGEALTAVASRCCFHPSLEKLVVAGGNSSGRMTVVR